MSRKRASFTDRKIDTRVLMASKYLPANRRDLSLVMTAHGVALFFAILVQLKLCKATSIVPRDINNFARRLHKLVQRRHTKIWDLRAINGQMGSECDLPGSSTSSTSSGSGTSDGPPKT